MTDRQQKELKAFLEFRNKTLGKKYNLKGYQIFSNAVAEAIVKAEPISVHCFKDIKGFPQDGERMKKYAEDILKYFGESKAF